jgi:hypothetical protein
MLAERSGFNLADDDRVIAARIDSNHDTFQRGGCVVEQWRAGYAGPVAYVAEAVLIFGSKSAREVFLIFRENIDSEMCSLREPGMNRSSFVDASQDQWWIEGH